MSKKNKFASASMIILACGSGMTTAMAQEDMFDRDRVEGAGERFQPSYSPRDIRVGSFIVKPQLEVIGEYDTNVFAVQDDEEADTVVTAAPKLQVKSDWNRHELSLAVQGSRRQYLEFEDESINDGRAEINATLDATGDLTIGANLSYALIGETRGQSGLRSEVLQPGEVTMLVGGGFVDYTRDRIKLRVDGKVRDRSFSDLKVEPLSLTDADRSYRDNVETQLIGKASYAVSPDVAVFVRGEYSQRDYDNALTLRRMINLLPQDADNASEFTQSEAIDLLDDFGIDLIGTDDFDKPINTFDPNSFSSQNLNGLDQFATQFEAQFDDVGLDFFDANGSGIVFFDPSPFELDAEETRAEVGLSFQLPQLIRGELAVGYFELTPDSPVFNSKDGLAYDAEVKWLPTELTTVTVGAQSFTDELGVFSTSTAIVSEFNFNLEHELKRNIILTADASYRDEQYEEESQSLDETREYVRLGLGAAFRLNRHAHFEVGYDLWQRQATEEGLDFTKHIASVGVRLFP